MVYVYGILFNVEQTIGISGFYNRIIYCICEKNQQCCVLHFKVESFFLDTGYCVNQGFVATSSNK